MMAEMRQRNIEQQRADYRLRQQTERASAMPGTPPASVIPPLTGGATGSEAAEKAAKAAEAAGRKYEAEQIRMQARLAENQLQTNEGLQSNAIELDNQRYENSKTLALKQFEFNQSLQSRALNLWSEGLMGPARAAAKTLTEFMMGFSEGTSRVAEAQRTVNDARRALQQAETVHKQTLANMTERQRIDALESRAQVIGSAGGGNGVGGLMAAANKNLGLFAGQTERCADAIRKLFQEAGIAIGVTKKAWDGLATGPRMASSFFGDDIGQRINRKEDLRPGDLVGFERTYGRWGPGVQTHVGMYAGGGMMFDHSSSRGVVRRPLDTFGGKFMYGVRPHALGQGAAVPMSQRLLPGADMPAFQPAPVRDVKGEGDIAQARERYNQAKEELKLIKQQNDELREFDRQELVQRLTQGLADQNEKLENSAQDLQLRNRLLMEGVRSEVIDGELRKANVYREQAIEIAAVKQGIDAIKDSEDKAAALAALEKMNGLYARQIELIDQAVAAQLDQPAAIALQIGQLKADLAEMVSIATLAGKSAETIGGAFGNAFRDLISGAASARQVLSGFFEDVAQGFAQMASEIIAKQMAMIALQAILKALGAAAGAAPNTPGAPSTGIFAVPELAPRALGGPTASGQPYKVGENGPELFVPYQAGTIIPAEATEALQAINNASLRGLQVPFQATAATAAKASQQGGGSSSSSGLSVPFQRGMEGLSVPFQRGGMDGGGGMSGGGPVDGLIRFEEVRIGEMDFVTRDEAKRMARESAKQGAALALKRYKNNPTDRRGAGLP
jgi:cell wall-associated NlpC family hydrolase